MIALYHGSTCVVERPLCDIGRKNLDFGAGFYLTDMLPQATNWALLLADKRDEEAIVNYYDFDKSGYLAQGKTKIFTRYDEEWLDFIVANRKGENPAAEFDYIEGGIANDRVVDTVRLYAIGLLTLSEALFRLKYHKPNNQICLNNQELVNKYLKFNGSRRIQRPG